VLGLEIFDNDGLSFIARWAHVAAGVVWIGLLYYFNFVQVPAFAAMDAGARNDAIDKLASRALWWFRWGAAATLAFGLLIYLIVDTGDGRLLFEMDYYESAPGVSIATGMLLGITMFANVWFVIWPNQKKVIANARNVAAGGQADPTAAEAGRKALLASRQNVIFSFPMLLFMLGTNHFFSSHYETTDDRGIYWLIALVLWIGFELNALVNRGPNIMTWEYENHWRAIGVGVALAAVYYLAWEIVF
jgi:uncharacterized membrane protein